MVIAGDLLDISSVVSLDVQIVVVLEYLARVQASTPVVVGSGNHDLTGPDANGEQAARCGSTEPVRSVCPPTATRSDSTTPGSSRSVRGGTDPSDAEAVAAQLAADAVVRPDTWVWVYHWPPLGSPTCWTGKRDYGDSDLGGWIAEHRPDLVLTGHVHQPPFRRDGAWADRIGDTWVFNAGRQIGPVPADVIIDLTERTATWRSLAGNESLQLEDTQAPARTTV